MYLFYWYIHGTEAQDLFIIYSAYITFNMVHNVKQVK